MENQRDNNETEVDPRTLYIYPGRVRTTHVVAPCAPSSKAEEEEEDDSSSSVDLDFLDEDTMHRDADESTEEDADDEMRRTMPEVRLKSTKCCLAKQYARALKCLVERCPRDDSEDSKIGWIIVYMEFHRVSEIDPQGLLVRAAWDSTAPARVLKEHRCDARCLGIRDERWD